MRRTRQVSKGIAMRLILTYCIVACCWGRSLCVPQQFINEFKSALLPLFGFKERPRIDSGKVQVPEALKQLYARQTDFQWDTASLPLPGLYTGSANTVRSFTHVESPIDETFTNQQKKFRLKFNISSIPKKELLKAAQMKLTREAISDLDSSDPYQRVLIIDILKRGVKGSHGPLTRVIDSKLIDVRKNSTISVDVFPAVEHWLSDPSSNHGILITIHTAKNRKHPPKKHLRLRRDLPYEQWSQKQPLLFTYTDDGRNKQKTGLELTKMRRKRAPRKHRKMERNPCQRQKMFVNFQEVGWSDWIVAPLGYQAFYCGGECEYPMPDHMNTTNHAIVQSLMNSARPTEVPKPCCVPTQLSSMSMLYVDSQKNVILKNYKEMVVVGCGCR